MKNKFCAKLRIKNFESTEIEDEFIINATIYDGSGYYDSTNLNEGDIIYINASFNNNDVYRYKVVNILNNSFEQYKALIKWDVYNTPFNEPLIEQEAIISTRLKYNIANQPDSSLSLLSSSFLKMVENAELERLSYEIEDDKQDKLIISDLRPNDFQHHQLWIKDKGNYTE